MQKSEHVSCSLPYGMREWADRLGINLSYLLKSALLKELEKKDKCPMAALYKGEREPICTRKDCQGTYEKWISCGANITMKYLY